MKPGYKTNKPSEVKNMSEKEKQVMDSLTKNAEKLTSEQRQRLCDIAYGMALVREREEEKKEA